MKKIILFLFGLVVITSSCANAGGYKDYVEDSYFSRPKIIRDDIRTEIEKYIGFSRDKIKELYGQKATIQNNINFEGIMYDEAWSFREKHKVDKFDYDIFIVTFYFEDGVVKQVNVF